MKSIKLALVASGVMFALSGCMNTQTSNNTGNSAQLNTSSAPAAIVSELSYEQQLDVLVAQYYNELLSFKPINATYSGRSEFNDKFTPAITQKNRAKKPRFTKSINNV